MIHLKRNPNIAKENLIEDKSGQVFTKKDCTIEIPVRFTDRGLGQIGINTFVYGCFPIIFEDSEYSVCNITSLIEIDPYKTTTKTIDEIEYYVFHFKANDLVIKTTQLVKRDTMMYNIFDEFIFKGKIPWYMQYEDIGKLFDSAKKYANSNVGNNQVVIELLASLITRIKSDRTKYLRLFIKEYKDVIANTAYVPLQSVFYSAHSTINKIAGNYFNDGVISALVSPSDKVEQIEGILRA